MYARSYTIPVNSSCFFQVHTFLKQPHRLRRLFQYHQQPINLNLNYGVLGHGIFFPSVSHLNIYCKNYLGDRASLGWLEPFHENGEILITCIIDRLKNEI